MDQLTDAYTDSLRRARALVGAQKWDAALKEIRRAMAAQPDSAEAHYVAGVCHYMLSQYPQARSEADAALRSDPEMPGAYWLIAVACERQNRYKEALGAIDRAIELDSTDSDYHQARSQVLLNSGKAGPALESAEEALRLDPENTEAKQIRTLALAQLGRHAEAEQEALESLRMQPDDPMAWYPRAAQLLTQGRIDEAREAALEALRLDPENGEAQDVLMRAIAARHAFFGLFWRWTIFIYRFPPRTRTIMIVAAIVAVRLLRSVARETPELRPVIVPILVAYVLFCIYTWLAQPLFRLAVRKGWIK